MKHIALVAALTLASCGSTNSAPLTAIPRQYQQSPHYYLAEDYLGLNERTNRYLLKQILGVDPVTTEWCAAFVNMVLEQAGMPTTENRLLARSFLSWGTKVTNPRLGDIVILSRGTEGWQGHVGFYVDTIYNNNIKYYLMYGGNQDNEIKYKLYPASKLLGIRRL